MLKVEMRNNIFESTILPKSEVKTGENMAADWSICNFLSCNWIYETRKISAHEEIGFWALCIMSDQIKFRIYDYAHAWELGTRMGNCIWFFLYIFFTARLVTANIYLLLSNDVFFILVFYTIIFWKKRLVLLFGWTTTLHSTPFGNRKTWLHSFSSTCFQLVF